MSLDALLVLALVPAAAAPPPDLTLKGYVLADAPAASVAVLASAGRTRVVVVGEKAFGGELASVSREGAVLLFGGERVSLRLAAAPAPVAPPPTPTPATASSAPSAAQAATFNMPRAEIDRRVALEMDRILSETALAPVTEGGRVSGVAIRRLAAGTVLSEVGLRVGDVITEINGTRIDGLSTLMGLYGRLQGEKLVSATVLRDGQPIALKLNMD